jgi:pilus assembly protein CpaE
VSDAGFGGRHVLLIGPGLKPLAEMALAGAAVEAVGLDPGEALAGLRDGLDLVLVDADAAPAELVVRAVEILAHRSDPPAVLLIGARLPTVTVRALLKLPRSDVLEAPATADDLAKAAAQVLSEPVVGVAAPAAAAAPGRVSHCWSVMGAVGGSGATTVAIELAAMLARRASQPGSVALVDLNLAFGAAAAYLGASAKMRLAEASAAPDRIDATILDAFAVRVEAGFDLLATPRDPLAFEQVAPAAVLRTLEMACQTYDWVIVDLPRWRQAWTLDVLAGSDEVLIVSELTVPALLQARALAGDVEADAPRDRRPRLILNRMASRAFGPAPSRAEAEKALGRKVDGAITSDWEAAACSVNLGGPISQHRPRSKIVKDVMGLLDRLTVQAHAHATAAPSERSVRII